jgi:peptide/nickel transport system substrate-binding protein
MLRGFDSERKLQRIIGVCALTLVLIAQTGCSWQDSSLPSRGSTIGNGGGSKDTVVFGMLWEPVGFNPIRNIDSGSYYAQTLVYEGLVKYDAELKIVPALAEAFQISEDQLTYTVQLRKNLQFSDGSPLTGTDVLASYQRAVSPGSPFKADFEDIDSCEVKGEEQIVFHLRNVNAALLSRLVELKILPAKLFATANGDKSILSRSPIASGPFALTNWQSGLELTFVPNPFYWGEKPKVDRLIWRVIPDKSLLDLCLLDGEIDIAQVDAQGAEALLKSAVPRHAGPGVLPDARGASLPDKGKDIEISRFNGSRTIYLGFNLTRAPFDKMPVRQAICQAIDRESIVKTLFYGYARLPNTDVAAGSFIYNPQAKYWPYAPERAKAELKDVSFRLLAVQDSLPIAEVVSADLNKVGVKNEVQIVEFSTLKRSYLKPGKFDVVIWSRSSGPDPEATIVWRSDGPLNFCRFKNAKVDKLLEAGRRAKTAAERIKAYQEIQTILAEELPWVFLVQPELLIAHSSHWHNIQRAKQNLTGLPWDNPLFNAAYWQKDNLN